MTKTKQQLLPAKSREKKYFNKEISGQGTATIVPLPKEDGLERPQAGVGCNSQDVKFLRTDLFRISALVLFPLL